MLKNSQPFAAGYKWVLGEGADPSMWSVTPASGRLEGLSTEEVTVRWTPKPKAPPGETEVSTELPSSSPSVAAASLCLLVYQDSYAGDDSATTQTGKTHVFDAAVQVYDNVTNVNSAVCAIGSFEQLCNYSWRRAAHLSSILHYW